jgi:hypothetical protein
MVTTLILRSIFFLPIKKIQIEENFYSFLNFNFFIYIFFSIIGDMSYAISDVNIWGFIPEYFSKKQLGFCTGINTFV